MKRWVIATLALLLLLTACGGNAVDGPADTVRAMSQAYTDGDLDTIMALYNDDSIVKITNDIVIFGDDIEKWVSSDLEEGNRFTATEIEEEGNIASFIGTLYNFNGDPMLIATFEAGVVEGKIVTLNLIELIDIPGFDAPLP